MGTFRDDLLPDIDDVRSIPGEMGLRRFQVWARVTTYSGSRVGEGTKTVTDTRLLVGGQDPKVREVHSKDVVAGTGEMQATEFDIGPLTPAFAGGGIADATINPEHTSTPTTILFVLKGPGLPASGLLCQRVTDGNDHAFRSTVRVRSSGRKV